MKYLIMIFAGISAICGFIIKSQSKLLKRKEEEIEIREHKIVDIKTQKETIEKQKKEEQKIDEQATKIEQKITECEAKPLAGDVRGAGHDLYADILNRVSDTKK